ncbi:MAG: helix-turn-helix domain-containing protein [Elusimicrobia bacterium]|nr:helix-turn-helix domain-containing protein [Elusimicrobiota bacterium]
MVTVSSLQPLVSVNTLAGLLDVSPRTVRGWVLERKIPYHKVGKLVRFSLVEVRGLVEAGRVEAHVKGILTD